MSEVARTAVTTAAASTEGLVALLLALGDDELVIGHRHSHWTGVAPHLEEDLALSSIAQDEIGHAVVWYRIAVDVLGADGVRRLAPHAGPDADPLDALGLGRPPEAYRHAVLVERPPGDWAYSVARQYLYDTADDLRLRTLAGSTCAPVAEATGALLREERYHLRHARAWVERLAGGSVEARRRIADGMAEAFGDALGLFEPLPDEERLVADGVLPVAHEDLLQRWLDEVSADLERVGLERVLETGTTVGDGEFVPTASGAFDPGEPLVHPHVAYRDGAWTRVGAFRGRGGRHGRHGEDWPALWEELTGIFRAHPDARW